MPDCPRCGALEALKENYRLAEAVARGEESRATQLEANLKMASGEIRLCHQRIRALEVALNTYGRHNSDCASMQGAYSCSCDLVTALRGTPDG